jgi:molecular chaperone DnaK (HSP70)
LQVRDLENGTMFVDYLIARNSDLPVQKTKTYLTLTDNQTGLDVIVMEQREEESMEPEENSVIHDKPIDFPMPIPKDSPVNVTFSLDRQGILHILIEEPKSKETWEVDIDRNGKISEAEIAELKAELAIN